MADTSTERARRARAHARDDHSLCRPQRCGIARAHVAEVHDRCDVGWCETAHELAAREQAADRVAPPVAGLVAPPDPGDAYVVRSSALDAGDDQEFGPAGRTLWDAVNPDDDLPPMPTVLLREACRIADRCEALERQLRGNGPWLDILTDDGRTYVLVVSDVLKESRQQAMALKALVAELRQTIGGGRASGGRLPSPPDGPGKGEGGGSIVDITAAIKAKLAATQG